ncbi:hypothetical protein [Acidisphaera sp. L21]|uniref:hypothetical protein n=1 Tax=Acidisphaera sp. L21 TaxID=1641851 RepID=UPI00131DA822|nr:hypothetical protein [Acidisphaera sp. L21]
MKMLAVDFNALEVVAVKANREQRYKDALRIYLFMSDGDPTLDGGYLAERIAKCYEALNDVPAARYWYGRAFQENPEARPESIAAVRRLGIESYEDLLALAG